MKYLLDAEQMKAVDAYSIQEVGIPSMVLMERAAYAVTHKIIAMIESGTVCKHLRVLCVCGKGNNGADGLAVARQLQEHGIYSEICVVGSADKKGTPEFEQQLRICKRLGIVLCNKPVYHEYNVIVDAIFGIGLSRDVQGIFADRIQEINEARNAENCRVIAVDIASGINATDGSIMGTAVCADDTVTFGYEKLGMCFYPGANYSGNIEVEQVGFAPMKPEHEKNYIFTYTDEDLCTVPKRRSDGNKGTFGKVAVIAGSNNMGGAACMAAKSAYRSGCGLVKVLTVRENKNAILMHVPEAIFEELEDNQQKSYYEVQVKHAVWWADSVIVGPGLSQDCRAQQIVESLLEEAVKQKQPKIIILDADALNIIATNENLKNILRAHRENTINDTVTFIITPHVGEMARLSGKTIAEIKKNPIEIVQQFVQEFGVICVLKDARTIVSDGEKVYVNTSGNAGMATGGSGDVLTGVIAGMIQAGIRQKDMNLLYSTALGVYLHGRAGDLAKCHYTEYGMTAMNIVEMLPYTFKEIETAI